MYVLCICGSTRKSSTNLQFLRELENRLAPIPFKYFQIELLPPFDPNMDFDNIPEIVRKWRSKVNAATQIIVCTPEYLHNIPAILKNSLEWLSSSGEMVNKPVLAITLTPRPPRGQYAMISLLNTLKALDAVVIAQLVFYVSELSQSDDGLWNDETTTLFNEQKSFLFPHFGKL